MFCFERASVVRMGTMPPLSPSTPQMPARVATKHWMIICGREDKAWSERARCWHVGRGASERASTGGVVNDS